VQKPTTMPWGNRSILFRDPDGNLVNLFTPVTEDAHQQVPALNKQPPAADAATARADEGAGPLRDQLGWRPAGPFAYRDGAAR